MKEDLTKYLEQAQDWIAAFLPNLALAVVALLVGFWLVRKISRLTQVTLNKAKMAPEVTSFLGSLVDIALKITVLLIAAGFIGFELTSLVAVLAAAGFAVGLALQGNLSNFAAGITIMVFKPYKLGDWVEICERFGRVESIQIFNTTIVTPGQKVHIVPNGQVVSGVITNYSDKGHIHLELQINMPYAESFPRVKGLIESALRDIPEVLQDPAPSIGIESYDTHFIVLAVRPFINPDHYWSATFACNQAIKAVFHANGVKMAYSEGVELGDIGE